MKTINFVSRDTAKSMLRLGMVDALISVSSSREEANEMRLLCPDKVPAVFCHLPDDDSVVNPYIAKELVNFLERGYPNILVHCDMGVSRSAAIATFACDFLGYTCDKVARNWPQFNRVIYQALGATKNGGTFYGY